jgi:DNA-directed RNA polymerase specialized sigma24 family protein
MDTSGANTPQESSAPQNVESIPDELPVRKKIRTIPDAKRLEIIKTKAQNFNPAQIGRKLDIPPNIVRSLVHRMQKNQTLHGTRGRPKKQVAPLVLVEAVTLSVGSNPL